MQVSYRERMAAVGRMPTTLSRNEQGENLREAATANAIECALQALLPPGIACPMQARYLRDAGQVVARGLLAVLSHARAEFVLDHGGPFHSLRPQP